MNILQSIFEQDINSINTYYQQHDATKNEMTLAFLMYASTKNISSIDTIMNVVNAYSKINPDHLEQFARHMGIHTGLDIQFFNHLKNNEYFNNFLEKYHDDLVHKNGTLLTWLNNGETNIGKGTHKLHEAQQLQQLLDSVAPNIVQNTIPDPEPSFPLDMRLHELKAAHGKQYEQVIEDDLILKTYEHFKQHNLPIDYIENAIETTRKIRNTFVANSFEKSDSFSPLVYCIHKDIILAIGTLENLPNISQTNFDYKNLWENINRYNLDNIKADNITTVDTPFPLEDSISDTKLKQAIWVLTADKQLSLGKGFTYDDPENTVHHIDLANGKDVLSAGTILFSEDMKKIIAVNPSSGHYKPTVESCLQTLPLLEKSNFDTSSIKVCDFEWEPQTLSNEFTVRSKQQVRQNIEKMSQKYMPDVDNTNTPKGP